MYSEFEEEFQHQYYPVRLSTNIYNEDAQ
jgi:hypothetical protein